MPDPDAPTRAKLRQVVVERRSDDYSRWKRQVYRSMRLSAERGNEFVVVDLHGNQEEYLDRLEDDLRGSGCAVERRSPEEGQKIIRIAWT